jgi:pimeloyl-ACP methyl ester carboxylesterase
LESDFGEQAPIRNAFAQDSPGETNSPHEFNVLLLIGLRPSVFAVTIQSGIADVNGARLYFETAGCGEALVFIHGLGLDTRMWDPQFEIFAKNFLVVRYDLRGFGRSSVPTAESYSPAEDLHALLRYLRIPHAHILGLSLGGRYAVNFGLLFPQATKSLILVDSSLDGFDFSPEFLGPFPEIEACAKRGDLKTANQLWLSHPLFAPARENREVAPKLAKIVGDYSGWRWANRDPTRSSYPPAIQCLDQIRVPVLVLVGDRDLTDFRAIADLLAREIPGAMKNVLPGVGHMSNLEGPEQFNRIVFNFLSGLPSLKSSASASFTYP